MRPRYPAILLAILVLAVLGQAEACFGPKLFLGVPEGGRGEVLYALTSLYLKEKTGVETRQVLLAGRALLAELGDERLDLALLLDRPETDLPVLPLGGRAWLVSGQRPREDLQFTTVIPALAKLAALLADEDLAELEGDVDRGTPPAAAARRLLTARGWI